MGKIGGYTGKLLFVDLSKRTLYEEEFDESTLRAFIGGYGLGAQILLSRQPPKADPLGPDNLLGFMTGPLTGTPALFGAKYMVVSKSPLTGGWGDANCGGSFGPFLKFGGYDGVIFSGLSPAPVYLLIDNGKAELRDAGQLWGKDTTETEDLLKTEFGQKARVVCIGPSGEKKSLISCIITDKGRAAGRSGLGAVMGAKGLKAIVTRGDKTVPLAHPAEAKELRRHHLASLKPATVDFWKKYGTSGGLVDSTTSGDSPIKNWGGVPDDFPQADNIGGDEVIAQREKKYGCWQCPMACSGLMKRGTGLFKYEASVHQPEYETLSAFGPMCLNDDLASIIKLNDISNRYGLDTISAGATIAFAIECYENGLITKADTDGIELRWGDSEAIVTMAEKMARRESFGEILGDGVKKASERIKGSAEYAIQIDGQEAPMHNPKYAPGFATTYGIDATPARHTVSGAGSWEAWGGGRGLNLPEHDKYIYSGKGEIHKKLANLHHALSCLGLCSFSPLDVNAAREFVSAIIGWDLSVEEMLMTGERIANARQLFNIREGLNALERVLPRRMLAEPSTREGPLSGISVDYSTQVREYLEAMDWDTKTGRPSQRKLSELGLEALAKS